MKYFIDTEFIEGFHKPFLGKKRHFIDLISIALVAEDGRELYLVSNEFNPDLADELVHKNVLAPLYDEMVEKDWNFNKYSAGYTGYPRGYTPKRLKTILKRLGSTNELIREKIKLFVNGGPILDLRCGLWPNDDEVKSHNPNKNGNAQPEFYAYYADYDWVLFCSIFGRMIDLPDGFPMYCRDLKQSIDDLAIKFSEGSIPEQSFKECLENLKIRPDYPKQAKEHNALDDARWNKDLFNFLNSVLAQ